MKTKLNGFLTLVMLLLLQTAFAQTNITGVVTDQSGLPIPGVNVLVKGTQNGVQTDFDGKFSITANPGQVLVFSFIGMKTKEQVAAANMKVEMADNAVELEGVVVTALGIKKEKKALGYSATQVKNDQLTTVVNSNVFESLSGKIAGVDITSPGQAGASSKIIVRGISSITQTNAPLYIVDGTPINNSATALANMTQTTVNRTYDAGTGINDLDPNTIESINFLKGAAATALYGSKGGNGVFIITTKKGKNQSKINVDIVSSVEANEVARVAHLQNEFGQGWAGEGFSQLSTGLGSSNENGSWGPAFNGEIRPWGTIVNNSQQVKPYVALEDNVRDFYDTGLMTSNSVTVSGGSDFSDFALTFTNLDSDGIIPTDVDSYIKRTFAFNGGLKGKKFAIRASINYSNKEQFVVNTGQGDDAGEGATLQQDLLQVPRDISVVDHADYINNPFATPSNFYTPYATNPYWSINENSTKITGHNVYGNTNMSLNITPELTASWQIGGNVRNERVKSYGAIVNYADGSAQALAAANPVVGGVTEGRIENTEFDTFFNLTYDKKLTDKFNLNVLLGTAYNQRENDRLFASITNLGIPNYYELSNSAARPVLAQSNTIDKTVGVYVQAELAYNSRIYLTLTARNDKNSTLPIQNSSYFYPSASISGILMDTTDNFLKLRAGIARVGNGTTPYQTYNGLVPVTGNAFFGAITSPLGGINSYEQVNILGNPELRPEMTTESEIGIEGNLFKNRVTFDISAYMSKTTDLITAVPLAPSTGYATQAQNIGDLENKGIEIALGLTPIKTADFKWEINYTFSKNNNEVTELNGADKILINSAYGVNFYAVEGQPIGVFQALVEKRNDAGQIIVDPATGFAEVGAELQTIGDSQRDFVMGLQNTFKYKNLSFQVGFDWKQGGKMYSYTDRLSNFTGNSIESTYNGRAPFIVPNSVNEVLDIDGTVIGYEENVTPVDFASVTDYWGNTQTNPSIEQQHLIDKSFVRLRELNLTYSFSTKVTEKLGLARLSISAYGKNLFMWTPDDNPYVDPEVSTFGSDVASEFGEFGGNPSQRAYGAILKVSF